MRRTTDPGFLKSSDLENWYRRTIDQVEAERKAAREYAYRAFFDGQGDPPVTVETENRGSIEPDLGEGWREARLAVQPARPLPALRRMRIGVPPPEGSIPVAGPSGGFFRAYRPADNPMLGPAYFTDLPSPLNLVTPRVGGWFELGDGSLVRGVDEIEHLYAEQQRLMLGEDEVPPDEHVRTVDLLKDGVIPPADQVARGQREKDPTCHPYGAWEQDSGFASNSNRSRRYESQINRAPGLDYVVRNPGQTPVKFDGCAVWDPKHQLLEAKGPAYQGFFQWAARRPGQWRGEEDLRGQVRRQSAAAPGKPIEWHVAEPGAVLPISAIAAPYRSIRVLHTPER